MANSYRLSNGEYIKKSVIDARVRQAKQKKLALFLDEYGYFFCEDCKKSQGERIDCSHDISVDRCQKEGRSELAYDINNITLRCRICHQKHD